MVAIVWQLDLQLPLKSVPITTCRHGRDRMAVGFTTTYEISTYHHMPSWS
jgi:hypothetical protein